MSIVISDELLTAFLDGELDISERSRIEAALETDPDLQARLAALDLPLGAIRGAGDLALRAAPERSRRKPVAARSARANFAVPLSLAAGIALGVLGTQLYSDRIGQDWVDAVVAYQELYVPETIAIAAQAPEVSERVLKEFGAEHQIALLPATEATELEFKRAQLLGYEGRPLLQMAYVNRDGQPVAFCITRVSADQPLRTEQRDGIAASYWASGGNGFALVGPVDPVTLERLAKELSATL